jgi:hypothetical protein
MFDKITYTWELMGASWQVLKKDKEIIFFPLLSGICCLLLLASLAVPLLVSDWRPPDEMTRADQVLYYAVLFVFYFCNYFIITFFNVAIVACAVSRMAGGDPTFSGGLNEAFKRIHLIAGWALVSATVGLILRMIEDRSEKIAAIVAGILGMAWTVMTFLVVPVLVVENKGPIDALKESTRLLKHTWGEQIIGNFSFGLLFFLLGIPGFALVAIGLFVIGADQLPLMIGCIALGIAYFLILSLIQSALQAIFQAAVYMHTQGVSGGTFGFPVKLLSGAMGQK